MLNLRQSEAPLRENLSGYDRRSASRYTAPGTPALIGWIEGDEHRTSTATLIDVSLGGCAAQVTTFPPEEGDVWIRLVGPESSPWIKASVVATIKRGRFAWTRRLLRLRFIDAFPYDMFKAAIEGFSRELRLPDFEAEGFSIRDWR